MTFQRICQCALLLAGAAMSACAVGPEYVKPPIVTPPAFKEGALPDGTVDARWKPADPKDAAFKGSWWEVFGDPPLSALEEQVTISNQNIAQAEAAFRAARAAIGGARAGLFPTVTVGASASASSASANRSSFANAIDRGVATDYQLPVDFSYEADVWGGVRRNIQANRAIAQATAANLETVTLSMRAELAIDYFQLRSLDAQRELLDSTVAAYDRRCSSRSRVTIRVSRRAAMWRRPARSSTRRGARPRISVWRARSSSMRSRFWSASRPQC
jgi:outer membrane protein TolC